MFGLPKKYDLLDHFMAQHRRRNMKIPERLKEIAEQLENGNSPSPETVRIFIGWFGAQRRGYEIVRDIRKTLEGLGIQTKPNFNSAFIDSRITFVKKGADTEPEQKVTEGVPAAGESRGGGADTDILISGAANDPTYRIGKLESANLKPLSVLPDCLITEAITHMLVNDYSQLPVIINDRNVKGMISWKTLGSRLALEKNAIRVGECMEPVHEVSADASLFGVISQIVKFQSVLVRAQDRTITGIVTTSDLSVQFRQLSEPFLLLAEIENHIRGLIDGCFSADELAAAKDESDSTRQVHSVASLTFGEHIRLLENPKNWNRIGLNVDRAVFTRELNKIRGIRNDVMHFDPDGISEDERATLRRFVHFLQKLQDIMD